MHFDIKSFSSLSFFRSIHVDVVTLPFTSSSSSSYSSVTFLETFCSIIFFFFFFMVTCCCYCLFFADCIFHQIIFVCVHLLQMGFLTQVGTLCCNLLKCLTLYICPIHSHVLSLWSICMHSFTLNLSSYFNHSLAIVLTFAIVSICLCVSLNILMIH